VAKDCVDGTGSDDRARCGVAIGELRRVVRRGGVLLAATNGQRHTEEINAVIDAATCRARRAG